MSQPQANRLLSKIGYKLKERKNLKLGGPKNRHERLKKIVTGLLRHERLELSYPEGDEARGYIERLISDAVRHGDCHIPTMEMASYWITEKPIIHKLFKVLAPRYKDYETITYTKMWRAPRRLPGHGCNRCVLELRGNIYPPLGPDRTNYKNLIHNVLLREAQNFFDKAKEKDGHYKLKLNSTETKTQEPNTNLAQAAEISEKVPESLESEKNSVKLDSQETKNETSSTAKDSVQSQSSSDSTSLDSSESLGVEKLKIKDEELPQKEK